MFFFILVANKPLFWISLISFFFWLWNTSDLECTYTSYSPLLSSDQNPGFLLGCPKDILNWTWSPSGKCPLSAALGLLVFHLDGNIWLLASRKWTNVSELEDRGSLILPLLLWLPHFKFWLRLHSPEDFSFTLQRTNPQVARARLGRWAPQGWLQGKAPRGSKCSHLTFPCPSSPETWPLTPLVRSNHHQFLWSVGFLLEKYVQLLVLHLSSVYVWDSAEWITSYPSFALFLKLLLVLFPL